jgi:hypothetical protein
LAGRFFQKLGRGVAQVTTHNGCDVSECFELRNPVEIGEPFFVGGEFELIDFPIIIEPRLDLFVPDLGVLWRQ